MSRTHRAWKRNDSSTFASIHGVASKRRSDPLRLGSLRNRWLAAAVGLAGSLLFVASTARADVAFYLSPEFGISGIISEIDGVVPGAIIPLAFSGEDSDAAPVVGGAIGLEMPMDELLPREWLADIRLPNWPIRFEIEAAGAREYDLVTKRLADKFFSEITATTLFANAWVDVPMLTIWRPFQYVFGLGRQPRVRSLLEPASFFLGSGVGFTAMEFQGTDNVFEVDEEVIDFAWNVGAGFRYAVTDRVSISTGYRYVGLGADTGSQEVDIRRAGSGPRTGQTLEYDFQVHEFLLGIQIKLFSFRGAWR